MTPTRRKTLLRTIAGNTAKAALLIGSSMLILFLADRTLQLLGYTDRHGFHIAHLPNIRATVDNLEYSYDVATNSQGLRYKEIPFEKDDNEYRFIVLGDSFVEGTGVEAGDTFAALLEQQYSRAGHIVRFINAGLAGTGPHDYLRLFHFIGRKYQPDAVLIALFANDAADSKPAALSGLRTSGCITDFVQKTCLLFPRLCALAQRARGRLKAKGGWKDRLLSQARTNGIIEERITEWQKQIPEQLVRGAEEGRFEGWLIGLGLIEPDYWRIALDIHGPNAEERYNSMIAALGSLVDECRELGLWVGIVLLPAPFEYNAQYGDLWRQSGAVIRSEWLIEETELAKRLSQWSQQRHLPFKSLTPEFRQAQSSASTALHYQLDHHWTPHGHKLAADAILRWLTSAGPQHKSD